MEKVVVEGERVLEIGWENGEGSSGGRTGARHRLVRKIKMI